MKIAEKTVDLKHITGPLGVRGRNSDNKLIRDKLEWEPSMKLDDGLKITYNWIFEQIKNKQSNK